MIRLSDRAVFRLSGEDAGRFLQGAVTNDVRAANGSTWLYALMLTHNGRVLYDLFITVEEGAFIVDHRADHTEAIMNHFQSMRFRSKIELSEDGRFVVANNDAIGFPDPRHPDLGYRMLTDTICCSGELNEYHSRRMLLRVPDVERDMIKEVSFPLDYRIDLVNGISFNKGCYCGQEAIMKAYSLKGRRRDIFAIESEGGERIPLKGTAIVSGNGTVVGKTCGSVNNIGLGVFVLDELDAVDTKHLFINNIKCFLRSD